MFIILYLAPNIVAGCPLNPRDCNPLRFTLYYISPYSSSTCLPMFGPSGLPLYNITDEQMNIILAPRPVSCGGCCWSHPQIWALH